MANFNTLYLLQHQTIFHQKSDMTYKNRPKCFLSNCGYSRQKLQSITQISHVHKQSRQSTHHFVASLSSYTFYGNGLHFRITQSTFILDFSPAIVPTYAFRLLDAFNVVDAFFRNQLSVRWCQWTISASRILLTMLS